MLKKKKQKKFDAPFVISISFIGMLILIIAVLVDLHLNQPQNNQSNASGCTPDAKLVNPCRPWIGTVAGGDPSSASDAISQFNYFEKISGPSDLMDVFHDYHPPGSIPLNSAEKYFASRPNTYDYINYKPASTFSDAAGGNLTINNQIKQAADNIAAIAPTKVFLTVWHEPENDVSGYDSGTNEQTDCSNSPTFHGLKGSAGTPAQYRAMWQNVRTIFNTEHADNVVWVMNYMGYSGWDCLVPSMWPGNSLVDWVAWDSYATDNTPTWAGTVGRFYNILLKDESTATDFTGQYASTATNSTGNTPWAAGEFGTCFLKNEANAYTYFQSIKQAIDNNTYPKIKMYLNFSTIVGPGAGPGCLVDYGPATSTATWNYDATKLKYWNDIVNDPIFSQQVPTTAPTATPTATQVVAAPTATPVPTAKPTPTPMLHTLHHNPKLHKN